VSWHASPLDDEGGVLLLGHAESVAAVAAAG
jgi:hypothetical protein